MSTAFRRGELSYSKARALTRVATPANEVDLVSLALHATAAQLDRLVRAYRQATADGREEANARHARRYLRWYWDDDGSLSISGRLCPEDGAVVAAALKAAGLVADQRRRTKDRDQGQSGARDQPATETPAGESGGRAAAEAPAGGFGGGAGGESPAGDSGRLTRPAPGPEVQGPGLSVPQLWPDPLPARSPCAPLGPGRGDLAGQPAHPLHLPSSSPARGRVHG